MSLYHYDKKERKTEEKNFQNLKKLLQNNYLKNLQRWSYAAFSVQKVCGFLLNQGTEKFFKQLTREYDKKSNV